METFNLKATCAKCGYSNITPSIIYRPEKDKIPEHIERQCHSCGFIWKEATIDTKK